MISYVGCEQEHGAVFIFSGVRGKIYKSRSCLGEHLDGLERHASPDGGIGKGIDCEACDETKVVAATFQGSEQVRVLACTGYYKASIREDKLIGCDVVATQAVPPGVEREATS